MERFLDKVFCGNAVNLLRKLPSVCTDAVIADPMYMVAKSKGKTCVFDWGIEPGQGYAEEWWTYHQEMYQESLRVLRPGGILAWSMGAKFRPHFYNWFGDHRIWGFSRYLKRGNNPFSNVWVVQTKEKKGVRFPDVDGLLEIGPPPKWTKWHPCPKSEEEMRFLISHLTKPGEIVLDIFCGTGTTLVAARQLGRHWIGCDLSPNYCRLALCRLSLCCSVL